MKKHDEYAIKLLGAIRSVFDLESDNYISLTELEEGTNLTEFFHALANTAPAMVYESFTNENLNNLEFNHLANRLCFQYVNKVDGESEVSNG